MYEIFDVADSWNEIPFLHRIGDRAGLCCELVSFLSQLSILPRMHESVTFLIVLVLFDLGSPTSIASGAVRLLFLQGRGFYHDGVGARGPPHRIAPVR